MALQFKRNRVTAESIVSEQRAQIVVQAEAMISGAGRDSVEVLLEDASVSMTKLSPPLWRQCCAAFSGPITKYAVESASHRVPDSPATVTETAPLREGWPVFGSRMCQ